MITQEELKKLVNYDPETGMFICISNRQKPRIGERMGFKSREGYWTVYLQGERHIASKLAWIYVYGCEPDGNVRYLNEDRCDVRIANLKLDTPVVTNQDKDKANSRSKTGLLGVSTNLKCATFRASIKANGVSHYLGSFPTAWDAHYAYLQAKKIYHPESKLAQQCP